jgi:dolichol-phosphate mannosyltransferase
MEIKKSIVIIPTYNEIKNVSVMIPQIFELYPFIHVLVIDDGSPDQTAKKVKSMQAIYPQLHLIERSGKLGLGTAYITGFKWALSQDFENILEMDCDFSHDPGEIKNFLKASEEENADLIIGSRYINGIRICNWSMRRLLLSYFASHYIRFITGLPLNDATGGFKCFKRRALLSLDLDKIQSNGYSFQIEVNFKIWQRGLKIIELPITFYERAEGESKMSSHIVWEALAVVFRLRLKKLFGILN